MRKINIGYDQEQKVEAIRGYLAENEGVTHIVYFHPDKMEPLDLGFTGKDVEYRTYSDVIMYKYYTPLLENITDEYLLIFDEMLRTKKRNDLTYNCAHHYANQTSHVIVFQWLPIVDDPEDFMILVDLAYTYRYKGKPFDPSLLSMDGVSVIPRGVRITEERSEASEKVRQEYEAEKERLFDGLGNKDPDTIPRALHVWAGTKAKKNAIDPGRPYVARNARFKSAAVTVYKEAKPTEEAYVLDFPVRTMDFTDYVRRTGVKRIVFVNSGLSADEYYYGQYKEWEGGLEELYAYSNLSKRNSA